MAAILPSRMEVSFSFVKHELPFLHGLKSRMHLLRDESRDNDNMRRSHQMIAPNPMVQ